MKMIASTAGLAFVVVVVVTVAVVGLHLPPGVPHVDIFPFRPARPYPAGNQFDESGPYCTLGETTLCRGRLPDGQSNGTAVRRLLVERCDPLIMKSLSSIDLRGFGESLTVFRLECYYERDSSAVALELEAGALASATALESFAIVSANVGHLPAGLFCDTPAISRVDLSRNRLADIKDVMSAFTLKDDDDCGANLYELLLSANLLETIASDAFAAFVRLDTLDLSHNRLVNFHVNALRNMKSLRYLNLKGNRLSSLPDRLFVDVGGHFASLDLTDNELVDDGIYPALDVPLTNLQIVNLGQNRLTTVDGGRSTLFDGKGRTLFVLHYEYNRIEMLPDGVFRQLAKLSLLDLSNNAIGVIKSTALEGLASLVNLGLSRNNLTRLDVDLLLRCCSNSLMVLDVSGNRLKTLPDVSGVQRLYNVNASHNALETLDEVHFANNSIINTVDFSHNYIASVRNITFGFVSEMVELRLDHNRIHSLENGSFAADLRQTVALRTLRLDGNHLRSVVGAFHPTGLLGSLQSINLSSNRLESFMYEDVPYAVRDLRLADNLLTSLGKPFKYDLPPQTTLDVLDASANRISALAANSFPGSVAILLLAANRIESIDDFALINKPRLTLVDLTGNRMTKACPSWFVLDPERMSSSVHGSVSRPRLLISGNPLRCTCQLEWMTLANIDGFSNTFPFITDLGSTVCSSTFHRNRSITGNELASLLVPLTGQYTRSSPLLCSTMDRQPCPCAKFGAWPGPSQCHILQCPPSPCRCLFDGDHTTLIVDCSISRLEAPPHVYPINATVLYLDRNNITQVNRKSFGDGLHFLTELYLNASALASIGDGTFHRMTGLVSLYLQNNRLESLSAGVFIGLGQLRVLSLFSNRLMRIDPDAFSTELARLKILELHSNRLVDFAVWKMNHPAYNLSHVSVGNNPWSCECEFVKPFRSWMQDFSGVIVSKNNITCANRSGHDHQLIALNDVSLCRNDTTLMWLEGGWKRIPIALTTSLALVLIVATIASLLIYYRHEVQVIVYSRYGVRLFWLTHARGPPDTLAAATAVRDDADKLFDAFISYSSLDEDLVVQLVERLEQGFDPPYKLCLHHRNFAGGALITESIVEAVERSCRTIILVSENFLASEWCRFEFRAAYLQMLKDRRNRVIVVLVGQLITDRRKIDREINFYLKTNTYLRWDDRLFLQKLCFALPDRQPQTRTEIRTFNAVGGHLL